ncbi:MAG: PEP-CTERM sorting domain-containing protein [Planctomycetota bacterium]
MRVTFSGASSASGNNRLDNIQFSANAVPEPTTGLLLGVGTLACAAFRRNRRVA